MNKIPKKVTVTVHKVNVAPNGLKCRHHYEGQTFTFPFERMPQDFCAAAFHSIWPHIRVLELGGRHPWDTEENVTYSGCPDPNCPVVFKISVSDENSENS